MLYVDVGSYYKQHIPVKDLYGPSTSAYGLVKVSNRVKMSASLHVPLNVRRLRPVFQGVGAMTIMFANFPVIFMLTQLHFFSGAFHKELSIQPLLIHQDKLWLSMDSESHECAEAFFWLYRKMLLSRISV